MDCPLGSAEVTPFPVLCETKREWDAKGVHFAVQTAAAPLLTVEGLGQEYGRARLGVIRSSVYPIDVSSIPSSDPEHGPEPI